jgi:hypothetical protein
MFLLQDSGFPHLSCRHREGKVAPAMHYSARNQISKLANEVFGTEVQKNIASVMRSSAAVK